ncbi:MAG: Bifunctional ligase/repressor BirA [Chlamydiae bacterium]|nr:Bifunctional ligase/repressor BirA [Chlamydiota bacterium]
MKIIHHHFEILSSTNDWTKENLASFSQDCLTVVSSDEQTKGRGQFGRNWVSPPQKNLYVTFCFFPKGEMHEPLTYTHQFAHAIAKLLEDYGIHCHVKHPNDLFVEGKKIGGILSETSQGAVLIGLGLNCNMTKEELAHIDQPATSLLTETGLPHSPQELLTHLRPILEEVAAVD